MSNRRKIFIIYKIHPCNFPFVFLMTWFIKVVYWRSEFIPSAWLKRFEVMDSANLFTLDEWHQNTDEAFQVWKRCINDIQRESESRLKIFGVVVDFQYNILQWLAWHFQDYFHFLHLVKRWIACHQQMDNCFLAGTFFASWEKRMGFSIPKVVDIPTVHWLAAMDRLWQWGFSFAESIRQIYFLLRKTEFEVGEERKFRYIWTDINPIDIATGSQRLDFAFLLDRDLISRDDCLYLFLKKPALSTRHWLKTRGIRWALLTSYDAMLTLPQRLYAVGGICLMFFKNSFLNWKSRPHVPLLIRFCLQAYPWVLIAKNFPLKAYLATGSSDLCERPAVAVMNALGIRTINWGYSGNYFGYTVNWDRFQDLSLSCTLFVSKEIWLWNKTVVDWVEDRLVLASNHFQCRITGPIMSGDSRLITKAPADVRQKNGLTFKKDAKYIAIFDVSTPTQNKSLRLKLGLWPHWYPLEMLEGFFQDLIEVLNRFPNVCLILKLKRSLDDPNREYPPSLWRLIDPHGVFYKEQRVVQLDHDCDPYLAVAMADFCIGIPFTSPVLAGFYAGKDGVFHDPLCTFSFFRPQVFKPVMTRGREELMAKISSWVDGNQAPSLKHLDQLNTELHCELREDPTIRFYQMLQNQKDQASEE